MTRIEELLHHLGDPQHPLERPAEPPAVPTADGALARARGRRRRRLISAAGGAAAAVAVAVTVASAGVTAPGRATGPASEGTVSPFGARANLLLLGSDAGPDRAGVRADSVILASIDTSTGATTLVSLPRNLSHVPFPPGTPQERAYPSGFACADAGNPCLLNGLWQFGTQHPDWYPGQHPGLDAVQQGVEQATGQRVDAAVVLDLGGFARLVDAVGGVTVDVRRPIPVGGHVGPSGRQEGVKEYIAPGRHHLDGYLALWFARSRSDSSDYDRMQRQRCLVGALVAQTDWTRLVTGFPRIAGALRQDIATTIPPDRLGDWAALAVTVARAGHVTSLVVDDTVTTPSHPDYAYLHELVRRATSPGATASRPASTTKGEPHAVDVRAVC